MTTQEEPRVTQADEEWAEEVASAANIVTNGGYYEIDIDAVTLVIARHRQSAEAASKAREAALVEALERIKDHAIKLRKGTDDWFELVEIEAWANAALTKEPDA